MFVDLLKLIWGTELYNIILNTNAEMLAIFITLFFILIISMFTYLIVRIFRIGGGR